MTPPEHRLPIVEHGVVAGNFSDKWQSRNPVARLLVERFGRAVTELVGRTGATEIHEVGCGEGHLTARLAAGGRTVRGSDVSAQVIELARADAERRGLDVSFRVASVHELDPATDAAELVACCEVLEHVEDPAHAVDVLARVARPWLVASVPREPLWRVLNVARGKYLRNLGNTPGHLNHWSRRAFLCLLARRFEIVEIRSPIPWTVALCRARSGGAGG